MKLYKIFYRVLIFVNVFNNIIQASPDIQPVITITSLANDKVPALYVTRKNNIDYFFRAHCYYTLSDQEELITLYDNANVKGWLMNDSRTMENLGDVFLDKKILSASNYRLIINENNELQIYVYNDSNDKEIIHTRIVLPTSEEITIAKKYRNYKKKFYKHIYNFDPKERSNQRCHLPSPLSNFRMAKDWPYPHEEP